MAVVIRLRREGKKKQPYYRVVATDSRFARDGRFLEIIGQYNPLPEEEVLKLDEDRLIHWMKNGAKPSNTLKTLLTRKGLWKKYCEMTKPVAAAKEKPADVEIETDTDTIQPDQDEG